MMGIINLSWVLVLASSPALAQWLETVETTVGGTAAGAPCNFPYVYKGITYNECTTKNGKGRPWCCVTPNFATSRLWSWCVLQVPATSTRRGTGGRRGCATSYTYKGKSYTKCTGKDHPKDKPGKTPWCFNPGGKLWGECVRYPDIKTTDGQSCVFPFKYQNGLYEGCTMKNHNQGWCATSFDYDISRQWGNCEQQPTIKEKSSAPECPDGEYTKKDNTLSYGAPGTEENTVEKCKAACNKNKQCLGLDFDSNPGLTKRCFIHTNRNNFDQKKDATKVDQYTLKKRCDDDSSGSGSSGTETGKPVKTRGGNADPGSYCVFPFTYKGNKYTTCCSVGHHQPWCATTTDYPKDGIWGSCANIVTK